MGSFIPLLFFLFNLYFQKQYLSGILSESHTVLIKISLDILLVLLWVHTVCKGYMYMVITLAVSVLMKTLCCCCFRKSNLLEFRFCDPQNIAIMV